MRRGTPEAAASRSSSRTDAHGAGSGLTGDTPMGEMRNARLKGAKVLLVDDNEDSRYVLTSYLIHYGASVVTARSGGEALDLAGKTRCHVIVSDLSMPGIT